jgi:NAD(P)-dependent dehydrogenase (short-subunit alcohol dehydrogenase family)
MSVDAKNVVWITGATSGIGQGLARCCPWPDTKIFSVSRREHPDHETVPFELTDPHSWMRVAEHVTQVLATFRGERALFIHNALLPLGHLFVGEDDLEYYEDEVTANVVSPLVLGNLVIRAAQPAIEAGVDVGLVQISSESAGNAYPGMAVYCAAKASMEQWVKTVRAERAMLGKGPWVVAIRPGFVFTPTNERVLELPVDKHPGLVGIAEAIRTSDHMMSIDECADLIWPDLSNGAPELALLRYGQPGRATTRDAHDDF